MNFNKIVLTTLLVSLSTPVEAATWNFSYNGNEISASGELTTDTAGTLVTSISGARNGVEITGLLPVKSYANNDNIFVPSGNPGFVDILGLSYETNDNIAYNLYYSNTITTNYGECNNIEMPSCNFPYIGNVVSATFNEVPQPSIVLGAFTALAMLGFVSGSLKNKK